MLRPNPDPLSSKSPFKICMLLLKSSSEVYVLSPRRAWWKLHLWLVWEAVSRCAVVSTEKGEQSPPQERKGLQQHSAFKR